MPWDHHGPEDGFVALNGAAREFLPRSGQREQKTRSDPRATNRVLARETGTGSGGMATPVNVAGNSAVSSPKPPCFWGGQRRIRTICMMRLPVVIVLSTA